MKIEIFYDGPNKYKIKCETAWLFLDENIKNDIDKKIELLNKTFCLNFQYSKCLLCEKLGCLITKIDKPIYLCPNHIYEIFNERRKDPNEFKIRKYDLQSPPPTTDKHQNTIKKIKKIGRRLGYTVFTEYSVGHGKTFGRIDIVFKKDDFIFGFEVENYKKLNCDKHGRKIVKNDKKKLKKLGKGVIVSTCIEDKIDETLIKHILMNKKILILK